ncbi:WD40-repeat-containing domain protein [Kalaharituber pfeilii]|nr:WD40-repeat-containing domain protein [Kalaharituber pfeilii]
MSSSSRRIDRRYAHPPGPTYTAYSPDGKYIITVGTNNAIRKFTVASEDEPETLDDCQDSNTGLAVSNDKFITCSEDGTVSLFRMNSNELDQILVRCSLAARDVALSPDGKWAAVASDETTVKVVNTDDMLKIMHLREQSKSVKHVSFHPTGMYLAVSCTDGTIYVYSLATEQPALTKRLDGIIQALNPEDDATSKVVWHPDGRAFAAVTATKDIVVISRSTWDRQRTFATGHTGQIYDFAWAPNGAFLASAGADGKLVIWETKTQTILKRYDQSKVKCIAWHPKENTISYTNSDGELVTLPDVVPSDQAALLDRPIQPAPLINDKNEVTNREKVQALKLRGRSRDRDSLDELLDIGDEIEDEDDFIVDDDGGGYVEATINGHGKRGYEFIADDYPGVKRRAYDVWSPQLHESFQPGSTPWRGSRRYLSLNLIGFVWTVDQETHNTVTVEFYDHDMYRDFHFTDPYLYDRACLNEIGCLFSSPKTDTKRATLFYRPHETWSTRADWRIQMPEGEDISSIALSDSYIVACTSKGYIRVYTLFGIPFRVYRQKHSPVVACASWRDYVMVLANGPIGGNGRALLTYTIENVKRNETLQCNDVVALPPDGELKNVFFSANGDPIIYDSDGVLLVLQQWRSRGQAKWVPLLDTKQLDRRVGGAKDESYWPVAVAEDKFHCIILKGSEKYPYFPRPLLSEFDFKVPITSVASDVSGNSAHNHEEVMVRESVLLSLLEDFVGDRPATAAEGNQKAQRENAIDKALLQLLALECKEDHGEKALELCGLFAQPHRTLDLAIKIAMKYNRGVLAGKIGELRNSMDMEIDF